MSSIEAPLSSIGGDELPQTQQTAVPQNQQLQRNPQLPQHPLGAYTDAQYEAAIAALKAQTARQYQDVLQKLGYIDENGQFIQGSVETEAGRQRGLLNREMGLAREGVTKQHQMEGTLFSGLRGTDQARAEFPYADQLGQLAVNTPLTLAQLYEQASGLVGDYTIGQNQLLADAASRRAANLMATGGGGDAGAGGAGMPGAPTGAAATMYVDPAAAGITDPAMAGFVNNIAGAPAPANQSQSYFGAPAGIDWSATNAITDGAPAAAPQLSAFQAPATPAAPAPTNVSAPVLSAAQRKLMQWG